MRKADRPLTALPACAALVLLGLVAPLRAAGPTQFSWMYGLRAERGLEMAQKLGLNTLYLPTTNTGDSLRESQRVAQLARARGMQVIIALPALSQDLAPTDPDDEAFREEVGGRMRAVVHWLKDEPGVTAWAMADYPERELRLTPQGFAAFLQRRYGSLAAVNAAWGTAYEVWGQITIPAARSADSQLTYAAGRGSVDAADYQVDALRRLLVFWAEQVRGLDPGRPLFTGRLALYRSVASVPPAYSYVVPEAPVDVLEPDLVAGNIQAVDLARQGGAFEVVPSLRVPVPPEAHYRLGATLARWVREAQLHGARGVALDGVQRILDSGAPQQVLDSLGPQLAPLAGQFTVQPRPALAVLAEPYAGGRLVGEVPIYGYLAGLSPGEPSVLASALRLGSKFGTVDYLSLEHLLTADLEGYSAVLAPCALRLPLEAQAKLRDYVQRGGRLVCDFGAGVYETGSWLELPPELASLCGILKLSDLKDAVADLSFSSATGLFPSLQPPLTSQALAGGPQPASGTPVTPADLKVWTLRGPLAMATLSAEARPVGIAGAWPGTKPPTAPRNGPRVPPVSSETPRFSGLMAHPSGAGWAAFCTGALWSHWDPGDLAFRVVHADLWAPRAEYVLEQSGLWPEAVEICAGAEAVWLLNLSGQELDASLLARDAGGLVYAGAFMWFPLAAEPVAVELMAPLPPGQVVGLASRPVQILPVAGGVFAHLREYAPDHISLELSGPGAQVLTGLRQERMLGAGALGQALVVVSSGEYAIAPGSQHWVKVNAGFQQRREFFAQADAQGRLSLPVSGAHVEVDIAPRPSIAASGAP